MKSKKRLKVTIVSLIIFLLVVLGVGAVGFYVAGDYIFTTLLESYIEDEMMNSLGLDLEDEGLLETKDTDLTTEKESTNKQEAQTTDSTNKQEPQTAQSSVPETKDTEAKTEPKPKPMTQAEVKKVVKEKAKVINEAIPAQDKVEMSSLVLDNLTEEDISYLASLVADGISSEDLAEAKRIAKARFTEEEIAEVYGYYKEYQDLVLE